MGIWHLVYLVQKMHQCLCGRISHKCDQFFCLQLRCTFLFYWKRHLLHNIVLVSAIHQHESATGTHICLPPPEPLSHIPPHPTRQHSKMPQSTGLSAHLVGDYETPSIGTSKHILPKR